MIDFERINKDFKKFNTATFNLCGKCGGWCENNVLANFLPGEKEFIAKKLKMSLPKFEKNFVSKIKYKNEAIEMLC